ncbi:hypothetical protein KY311_03370 [Candidatus Woesearchaeota archaeon]|nr:hypothetical protein [Candidatus Woesearchaeota archaeon]
MGEELLVVKSKQDTNALRKMNQGREIASYLIPAVVFECEKFDLLIELVTGGVVVDIENSKVIVPPSLDEISMNELTILEQGMKHESFKPKDVAASAGINFFKSEALISDMVKRKLVTIEDGNFKVGDRFKFLYHPEKYSFDVNIEKKNVDGKKLEPKVNIAQLREMVEKVAKINAEKQCWINYHKVK